MNIIKRDGREVPFDRQHIIDSIIAASDEVAKLNPKDAVPEDDVKAITDKLYYRYYRRNHAAEVEEIQDDIEDELMKRGYYNVARTYIKYRRDKELIRKSNTTDAAILSLLNLENENVKQENSNKNPTIASTQRDYMAGEVSKDITKRYLLPQDIVEAHEAGIIHFHDADYFANPIHNCDLVNLEDMLQNGTVISGTKIEKPHSFSTACNIATQALSNVASSQYGFRILVTVF